MFSSPLSSQETYVRERDGKLEKIICLKKLSLKNKGDPHSLAKLSTPFTYEKC
jgi:hypothetical protein